VWGGWRWGKEGGAGPWEYGDGPDSAVTVSYPLSRVGHRGAGPSQPFAAGLDQHAQRIRLWLGACAQSLIHLLAFLLVWWYSLCYQGGYPLLGRWGNQSTMPL
jgi:hypothetical protein